MANKKKRNLKPRVATYTRSRSRALLRLWPWLSPHWLSMVLMLVSDILALITRTVTPLVIAKMIDGPISHSNKAGLWHYIAILAALVIAQAIFFALRRLPAANIVNVETAIRRDLYRHSQRLSWLYHDRNGSGAVLSRLVTDVGQISYALQVNLIWMISNSIALVVTAAMLIHIHPLLGVAVLVAMAPLGFASTFFQNRFRGAALEARERAGELATTAEESVLGVRVLKSLGGVSFITNRFEGAASRSRDAELEKIRLNARFNAFLAGYPVAVLTVVVLGGGLLAASDMVSIGSFVAFTSFYFGMLVPLNFMGMILSTHQDSISAAIRVFDLLDALPEITDPANPVALPDGGLSVQFVGVTFGYAGSNAPVLDGINLYIPAGESLAIVGETGAGKTTLGALVGRLADVTSGRVIVGGVDVRSVTLAELRTAVGFAFEEATLFSVSVRENLTFGRNGISDAEIISALTATQAEFVLQLPDGLDTIIGEQGLTLSGGQRQRIALARALLGRPRLLILDDPMSALDVRTEEALEQDLKRILKGVTTLIVARRPSTALLADRVALLDGGRISQIGSHNELMARSAVYRRVMIAAGE